MTAPYTLAVACHKGGCARTTTVAALAYVLAHEHGLRVGLNDSVPMPALELLAPRGAWAGVEYVPDPSTPPTGLDLLLVDAPPLTERAAQRTLERCDGVLVTLAVDPLALRTVGRCAEALQAARARADLDLLGLLPTLYDPDDPLQEAILGRLRAAFSELILEPPVAFDRQLAAWALKPGSELPQGPARSGYEDLARRVARFVRLRPSEQDRLRAQVVPPTRRYETQPRPTHESESGRLRGLLNVMRKISGRFARVKE